VSATTNAAGSDTQVQYNDGGTAFGGDAGLVYNDSTDVLTSGKLATTDTSATSVDFAGGITAGTGNVAIVNAAGQIPALSSTYLADLSGANLTGISAGKVLQVQSAYYTAQVGSTSSTFATTNVTDKITLADSDNKCLVIASQTGISKTGATSVQLRVSRAISGGATTIVPGTGNFENQAGWTNTTGTASVGGSTITFLDDPTTTSELTYTIEFANAQNVSNTYVGVGNGRASIVLIEIEV
jgi:hypothetical protein